MTSPMPIPVVTNTVTATTGGVAIPVERIHPAPGDAGDVWLIAATKAVTLTGPNCPNGFVLPVGVPVRWRLGGVQLTASSSDGTGTVSYFFMTNGR